MQSAREYLVSINLAKPGRGKFSNAAKQALQDAIDNGMEFSDWNKHGRVIAPVSEGTVIEKRAAAPTTKPQVKRTPRKALRQEKRIEFTKGDRRVVLDTIGPFGVAVQYMPEQDIEKNIPGYLKEFKWKLI